MRSSSAWALFSPEIRSVLLDLVGEGEELFDAADDFGWFWERGTQNGDRRSA